MDPATLQMLELGFSIAKDVLEVAAQEAEAREQQRALERVIARSVERLEAGLQAVVGAVVDKLESDKLEELQSRARNLGFLISTGRTDQVLQYAVTLKESVDYAANRIQEGKQRWIGSWLAGHGVFVAALSLCGAATPAIVREYAKVIGKIRLDVLDAIAPELWRAGGRLPWQDIAAFLRGDDSALLGHLKTLASAGEPGRATREPAEISITELARELLRDDDEVYFHPEIPARKLEGARAGFLAEVTPGSPLRVLYDNTIFGSAKEGLALFDAFLVYAYVGEVFTLRYDALGDSRPTARGSDVLVLDKTLKFVQKERAARFASLLGRLVEKFRARRT